MKNSKTIASIMVISVICLSIQGCVFLPMFWNAYNVPLVTIVAIIWTCIVVYRLRKLFHYESLAKFTATIPLLTHIVVFICIINSSGQLPLYVNMVMVFFFGVGISVLPLIFVWYWGGKYHSQNEKNTYQYE